MKIIEHKKGKWDTVEIKTKSGKKVLFKIRKPLALCKAVYTNGYTCTLVEGHKDRHFCRATMDCYWDNKKEKKSKVKKC